MMVVVVQYAVHVAALDSIATKFAVHGVTATFEGLDDRSSTFHVRLTTTLGA